MKQRGWLSEFGTVAAAIVLALAIGALLIILSGKNPGLAYGKMWQGAFGSLRGIDATLLNAIPLILTGLAVAFAFRGGLFNIGGEGQFLVGGFAGVFVGYSAHGLPPWIHLPLALLAGALGGAVYGAIPAILKAARGVHEVINTIMLNWIALYLISWLVNGPCMDRETNQGTPLVLPSAIPPVLLPVSEALRNPRLHVGIFVAILLAALVWWLLARTTTGYEVKAVGYAPLAAEYGGISSAKNMIIAMSVSGALAGLAGCFYYMAIIGRIPTVVEFAGYGFEGIAVALVGRNNPWGVVAAAFLFAALGQGGNAMQNLPTQYQISKYLIGIVQALVIIFVVAPDLIRSLGRIFRRRRVES